MNICFLDEIQWLNNFDVRSSSPSKDTKGWAQHHAQCNRNNDFTPGINVIMPLINEPVDSLKSQYHCMEITKKLVDVLNPGQSRFMHSPKKSSGGTLTNLKPSLL